MSDAVQVQALELQVSDNAQKAGEGLGALAMSLRRIKSLVEKGLNLGAAANQIGTFMNHVNRIATQENVAAVNRLAEAFGSLATSTKALGGSGNALKKVEDIAAKINQNLSGGSAGGQASGAAALTADIKEATAGMNDASESSSKITQTLADSSAKAKEVQQSVLGMVEALKQAKAASSDLASESKYIGKHQAEYTGKHASYQGIHEAYQGAHEAAQAASDYIGKHVSDTVREEETAFRQSAEAAEEYSNKLTEGQEALGQMVKYAHELYNKSEMSGRQLAYALDQFKHMDWNEIAANGGLGTPDEEKAFILDLVSEKYHKIAAAAEKAAEAAKPISDSMGEVKATAEEAAKGVEDLERGVKLSRAEATELAKKFMDGKAGPEIMKQAIDEANAKIAEARDQMAKLKEEMVSGLMSGDMDAFGARDAAEKMRELAAEIVNQKLAIDAYKGKWFSLSDAMQHAYDAMQRFGTGAAKVLNTLNHLPGTISNMVHSVGKLKTAFISANGGLIGFLHSMMRVAKFRLFRSLIRTITEGFSTGLENLRKYSKAVDNLYHKDITGLDNSLLKMKNSLGAMSGAAIQSLIPIFQQLAQWVITVSNYINQFIALISGRTSWTRAVDVIADVEDETKKVAGSAKSAAKETKNLLAAWDELNIIQSESGNGGGGSGGSAAKAAEETQIMFEEVEEFDQKIKDAVLWVEEHMEIIKDLAFLAVGKLLGFRTWTVVLALGIKTAWDAGADIAAEGLTDENLKKIGASALEGAAAGALAGFTFTKSISGMAIGALAGLSVTLGIAAISEMTEGELDLSKIDKDDLITWATHALQTALPLAGLGFVAAGVPGLAIGAVSGLSISLMVDAITELEDGSGKLSNIISNIFGGKGSLGQQAFQIAKAAVMGIAGWKALGGNPLGAIGGMAISILLDSVIDIDADGSTNGTQLLAKLVRNLRTTAATMAGFTLGAKVGGAIGHAGGAVIGAVIGALSGYAIITRVDNIISINEADKKMIEDARDAAFGQAEDLDGTIHDKVRELFRYDVDVYLKVTKQTIDDFQTRRDNIIEGLNKINSTRKVYATIGWKQVTPEEFQKLKEETAALVGSINEYIQEVKAFVTVRLMPADVQEGEGGELVTQFLEGADEVTAYVTRLGELIGKELEKGIVEGVNDTLYNDLQDALSRVTVALTTGRASGELLGKAKVIEAKYGDVEKLTGEKLNEYLSEYNQLIEATWDVAYAEAVEEQKQLSGVAAADREIYESYIKQAEYDEAEAARLLKIAENSEAIARGFDIQTTAQDVYDRYTLEGRPYFLAAQAKVAQGTSGRFAAANNGYAMTKAVELAINDMEKRWYTQDGLLETIRYYIRTTAGSHDPGSTQYSLVYFRDTMSLIFDSIFGEAADSLRDSFTEGQNEWNVLDQAARDLIYQEYEKRGYGEILASNVAAMYGDYSYYYKAHGGAAEQQPEVQPVEVVNGESMAEVVNAAALAEVDALKAYAEYFGYADNAKYFTDDQGGYMMHKGYKVYFDEEAMEAAGYTYESIIEAINGPDADQLEDILYDLGVILDEWTGNGMSGSSSSSSSSGGYKAPAPPAVEQPADEDAATESEQRLQTVSMKHMELLLQKILNKEFSARLVPSASTGATVVESINMYERVNG